MSFNNKPNKFHKDKEGKPFWESRSVAVEVSVFAIHNKQVYILVEKRSSIMMDGPNLWALPSGYMDYDETGWDAARRELYEETSLDIDRYDKICITNNNKQPFEVITDPKHNRQNIVLEYCIVLNFNKSQEKFPIELEQYKNRETAQIKWLMPNRLTQVNWAFNHDERIKNALVIFKKYIYPSFWRKCWNLLTKFYQILIFS